MFTGFEIPFFRIQLQMLSQKAVFSMFSSKIVLCRRIILPMQNRTQQYSQLPIVYNEGIVFYVYSGDQCQSGRNYMDEVVFNTKMIRKKDPNVQYTLCFTTIMFSVE